jgi:hypothetical protein
VFDLARHGTLLVGHAGLVSGFTRVDGADHG